MPGPFSSPRAPFDLWANHASGAFTLHSLTVSSRLEGVGTLRLRAGIVVNNLLLCVTGGFAHGRFSPQVQPRIDRGPGSDAEALRIDGCCVGHGPHCFCITANFTL